MSIAFISASFQKQCSVTAVHIILEIISSLQIILNIWEARLILYANALLFHVRDLNILELRCLRGSRIHAHGRERITVTETRMVLQGEGLWEISGAGRIGLTRGAE